MTDLTRFTDGSIAGRQAALPGPVRGLHRAVLRRFLDTGAPPTARWVTVRDGAWSWTPAGTVVVAARADVCGTDRGSFEVMCPHTVFHASRPSAGPGWPAMASSTRRWRPRSGQRANPAASDAGRYGRSGVCLVTAWAVDTGWPGPAGWRAGPRSVHAGPVSRAPKLRRLHSTAAS